MFVQTLVHAKLKTTDERKAMRSRRVPDADKQKHSPDANPSHVNAVSSRLISSILTVIDRIRYRNKVSLFIAEEPHDSGNHLANQETVLQPSI